MKSQFVKLRTFVLRLLLSLVPLRIKRMLVLGSLAAKMATSQEQVDLCRSKLNSELSLCKDSKALDLPFMLKERIWPSEIRNIDSLICPVYLTEKEMKAELRRVARRIVAKIPCVLYWGSRARVTKDVVLLLKRRQHIFA